MFQGKIMMRANKIELYLDPKERNPGQPVARIPWIRQQNSKTSICENAYFHKIEKANPAIKARRRVKLLDHMNEIFPFYLAKR